MWGGNDPTKSSFEHSKPIGLPSFERGRLIVLDAVTGVSNWQRALENNVSTTSVITGDPVYLTNSELSPDVIVDLAMASGVQAEGQIPTRHGSRQRFVQPLYVKAGVGPTESFFGTRTLTSPLKELG